MFPEISFTFPNALIIALTLLMLPISTGKYIGVKAWYGMVWYHFSVAFS